MFSFAGPTESNGEGNLDNSEGDFGSGGVGGSGGGQGSGFDEQPGTYVADMYVLTLLDAMSQTGEGIAHPIDGPC